MTFGERNRRGNPAFFRLVTIRAVGLKPCDPKVGCWYYVEFDLAAWRFSAGRKAKRGMPGKASRVLFGGLDVTDDVRANVANHRTEDRQNHNHHEGDQPLPLVLASADEPRVRPFAPNAPHPSRPTRPGTRLPGQRSRAQPKLRAQFADCILLVFWHDIGRLGNELDLRVHGRNDA